MALTPEQIVKYDIEAIFSKKPLSDFLRLDPPNSGNSKDFPCFVFSVDKITGEVYVTIGGTPSISKNGKWHIEIWVTEKVWKIKQETLSEALKETPKDILTITTGKPNKSQYVVIARKLFERSDKKNIADTVFMELLGLKSFLKKLTDATILTIK